MINASEWDYVVGFWGIVTGRLFHESGLRLKWGDTHLTVHDTVSDLTLKVDLRILHDRIWQGQNVETDIGVMEAAVEKSEDAKYIFDRCKILAESKAMIDKSPLDGCPIDSVDSLQIWGLGGSLCEPLVGSPRRLHRYTISYGLYRQSNYRYYSAPWSCFPPPVFTWPM